MNAVQLTPQATAAEGIDHIKRICFVCTGNTCRSPMAEAVFNHLAAQTGEAWQAVSRGIYAHEGDPISFNAVLALEEAGVSPVKGQDYHAHRAQNAEEGFLKTCDRILAMTPGHAMELILRFPALASRISAFPSPVSDPFGGDLAGYKRCLEEITRQIETLFFGEAAT